MPKKSQGTDTVRASREGHSFHDAWTARKAMQLLLPTNELIGIAVEGLSEEDQARASAGTVERDRSTIMWWMAARSTRTSTVPMRGALDGLSYNHETVKHKGQGVRSRRRSHQFHRKHMGHPRAHDHGSSPSHIGEPSQEIPERSML